jgi:hypothetical protein
MEVFDNVKIDKTEAIRIASLEFAIQLHNFRSDLPRETVKVIKDAKRIRRWLTYGT